VVNTPAYNSLWQVRTDSWSSLEESAAQLLLNGSQHQPAESLAETIRGLLDVLGPIERFWAFPGTQSFAKARRLFTAGKYDRFATLVSGINHALATDSFRSSPVGDLVDDDDAFDRVVHPTEQVRKARPYFEVLIVEDMTEQQERALLEEMRQWRRPDDPFIY
jgi:arginine decarboxylase